MVDLAPFYMVFDVESIGLYGEAFAVGWVVWKPGTGVIASAGYACIPSKAEGSPEDRRWVEENIPPLIYNSSNPRWVREMFWAAWEYTRKQEGVLVADVPYPVETRFIEACIRDDPETRRSLGPYPILDVASIRFAAGLDPLGTEERLPNELPAHDPLNDAQQSLRLFREAIGESSA